MTAPIVLAEKLRRPEPAGLVRPRLEQPLLQDLRSAGAISVSLLVAPPGSGKTTLLARVAAAATVPVAWYRVTSDETSEPAFVAHLARALYGALDIPALAIPPGTMNDLLAALDTMAGPALLILDDLHEIGGTEAERAVERFLSFRPPELRLLIGSRRSPDINVPRLRVSGAVREISSEDLRFRSWEVEELFVGVFAEPLSPESAAALTRRTGGWAAALQLFHLSTTGRSAAQRAEAVADLGGRSRLIRSYLARNVIAELTDDRRQFLLLTSTLGMMTGDLCDALLDTTGSAVVLDDLEQQQMFTSSDDDGRTFRYHEVLRTHLEMVLVEEYGSAGARAWYARSGGLLERAGEQRAAVRAYARAEDWAAVTRLIRRNELSGPRVAGMDLLLPRGVVDTDPWLALVEARRQLRGGAVASAVAGFRQAELLLDEPEFRDRCRQERALATLWTRSATPVGLLRAGRSETAHWTAAVRQATRQPVHHPLSGAGPGRHLAAAASALLTGDLPAARDALGSIPTDVEVDSTVAILARLAGAVLSALDGGEETEELGQIAVDAESAGLAWVARLARGLHEVILVAAGAPEWRVESCRRLPEECDAAGDEWSAALLRLAAAIAADLGGSDDTDAAYADAAARFERLDAPVLALWARALAPAAGPSRSEIAAEAERRGLLGLPALRSALRRARDLGATARVADPTREPPTRPDDPSEAADRPRVRIRCFGGFAIERDGIELDLSALRPLPRALLRLLALHSDRELHREHLIDLLWPEADLATGTRRLQVAVSSIRQVLEHAGLPGSELVRRRGDTYRLHLLPGTEIDVLSFLASAHDAERATRNGDLARSVAAREAALAGYCGELLPEDGPAEFVVAARERFRLQAAAIAAQLAQDERRLGRFEQSAAAARRSVELDPYQDLPWVLLVELHEQAGDHSAGVRIRREHARVQRELAGVD